MMFRVANQVFDQRRSFEMNIRERHHEKCACFLPEMFEFDENNRSHDKAEILRCDNGIFLATFVLIVVRAILSKLYNAEVEV